MSAERAQRGAGAVARASERPGPLHPVDDPDEIMVDVGEPESVDPSKAMAAGARIERESIHEIAAIEAKGPPASGGPGAEGGRRPRGRMTLRIPDDEVVRPSSPPPEPIEASPATERGEAPEGAGPSVDPHPTTKVAVAAPMAPDTVADLGDLAKTQQLPSGDTLRGLPALSLSQAERVVVEKAPPKRVDVEPPPDSLEIAVHEEPPSAAGEPPLPPPRVEAPSMLDIPVETEGFTESVRAPVSESGPPLSLDLEKLSSRPAPAAPTPPLVVPPLPAVPKLDPQPAAPAVTAAPAAAVVAPPPPVSPAPPPVEAAPPPAPVPPPPAPIKVADPPTPPPRVILPAAPKPAVPAAEGAKPAILGEAAKLAPPTGDGPRTLIQAGDAGRPAARLALIPDDDVPVSSARASEPGEAHEVSPEDVVSVESVPARRLVKEPLTPGPRQMPVPPPAPAAPPPAPPVPPPSPSGPAAAAATPPAAPVSAPKAAAAAAPATASKAARVQSSLSQGPSPIAPPPLNEGAAAVARRRVRPWWEELFNDDFIRTMAKITDAQIAAEADFIEDSLGVAKGAMVLDLACGTGRHAIELTRRGYQVVGFDLSLAMLARAADEAHDRNQKLNFVQGDMRDMTFEDTFDGVYSWNTSFGFFEEEKNAQIISNVRRALKTGGQFLLDVVNRDFLARQSPSVAWFEGEGCVCMDEMHIDWITSRMRIKRTMMMDDGRTKEIEYSIRVYSLHELGKLLHDHGFRVADVSGRTATPGVFFGADSPRTLILAEKR